MMNAPFILITTPVIRSDVSSSSELIEYSLTSTGTETNLEVLNNSLSSLQYCSLEDLDSDGKEELIAIWIEKNDTKNDVLYLGFWEIQNGQAVKTATYTLDACLGGSVSTVGIAHREGQTKFYETGGNIRISLGWYNFFNIDGTVDKYSLELDPSGVNYVSSPIDDWEIEELFYSQGGCWFVN